MKTDTDTLAESQALVERAQRVIPGCTQTFSKAPGAFVQGVSPTYLVGANGAYVTDVDGREYLDYIMALGPMILGYNHPDVVAAVHGQLDASGPILSLPHPLEVELAERLVEMLPCAEMVRFGKNGSDATAGAVRLARAYTGREIVAQWGYHGWQDWFIGATSRNLGVPQAVRSLTLPFAYNDIDSLRAVFDAHPGEVAAVVMEPVGVIEPEDGYLEAVRDLTHERGALLIFDEVVTGFRLALGGAQAHFGVTPDLACYGKAMANGFPLSALVGRREVMSLLEEVFFSFTFGGEILSLAAALATLRALKTQPVLDHIWKRGASLRDGFNALCRELDVEGWVGCVGLPPRTVVQWRDVDTAEALVLKSLFQQEVIRRGVLFNGGLMISYAHTDADIERTLAVSREALTVVKDAVATGNAATLLLGAPVQPVFRRP